MRTKKKTHSRNRSELWQRASLLTVFERQKEKLGERLKARRLHLELTQEAAAEVVGVHPNQLQRIEAGKKNVTLLVLMALASAYKMRLKELF